MKMYSLVPRSDGTFGLELIFYGFENIETITYPRYQTKGDGIPVFWKTLCAKYRYKQKEFERRGKKFEIIIRETHPEKNTREKTYAELAPVIVNPSNNKKGDWVSEFNLSIGNDHEILVKLGVASLEDDDYNTNVGDLSLSKATHPYKCGSFCGFDIFYQGVMIKQEDMETLPLIPGGSKKLSGQNRVTYGDLRGEIHILKGGTSVLSKNNMVKDPILTKLYNEAAQILKGEKKAPTQGAPKLNYITEYVHRRSANAQYAPEKVVKHRHRQAYKAMNPNGPEFMQETHTTSGRMDMYIKDVLIVEHKIQESKIADANQLFGYMVYHPNVPKGQLWAPKHSDETIDYVGHLNIFLKPRKQEIELIDTPEVYLNSNLSEDEKNL